VLTIASAFVESTLFGAEKIT